MSDALFSIAGNVGNAICVVNMLSFVISLIWRTEDKSQQHFKDVKC